MNSLQRLAEKGDAKAQADLGTIFLNGIGVPQDAGFSGTASMDTTFYTYEFYAGEANIVSPYLKSIQVIADAFSGRKSPA